MKTFIQNFFCGQRAVLFVVLFLVTAFMVMPFGSCSSNNPGTAGSTVNNNPETTSDDDDSRSRRRSDSSDDDEPEGCDESEGDPCKDDEYCSETCERIYDRQSSVRSCKQRGDKTVEFLEVIHNRLMGKDAGYKAKFKDRDDEDVKTALEKITDDDDDIGHNEFKCYLQIGANKYIEQLEAGLTTTDLTTGTASEKIAKKEAAAERLKETLKWIVEDEKVSEILSELNKGPVIVETLLEKLASLNTTGDYQANRCIEHNGFESYRPGNDPGRSTAVHIDKQNNIYNKRNDRNLDQALWWFDSDNLKVWYYNSSNASPNFGEADEILKIDKNLFNALSCFHKINNDFNNIFSLSASTNEGNEHIFEIAFNLLKNSCEDVKDSQKAGCARALMCWTSWQKQCYETESGRSGEDCSKSAKHTADVDNTQDLWNMAKKYKSELENTGPSHYNNCTTKGFYDFFR